MPRPLQVRAAEIRLSEVGLPQVKSIYDGGERGCRLGERAPSEDSESGLHIGRAGAQVWLLV
jgi:hypothetical protein